MPRAATSALAERRELEARLYAELGSLEAVAKIVGVSLQMVSKDLDKLGVKKRGAGQPAKYPKPEPIKCVQCGETFTPKSPTAAARGQKLCSKTCADESKAKYPKPEPRPCIVCGELFTPVLRRAGPTARTCSYAHERIAKAKYPQPEPRPCAHCGRVFTPAHPSAAVNVKVSIAVARVQTRASVEPSG